jgi:hypothetical protein
MPPLGKRALRQPAVFWLAESGTDDFGEPVVSEPIELTVRWEFTRKEMMGPGNTPVALEAIVYVDRILPIGSNAWRGNLLDWNDEFEDEILYVMGVAEVPDIKGRAYEWIAYLSRLKSSLATTVEPS